ncbi:30S ribosomal protein S20 [Enterobacteriaceae endosymbiont of Macroplea appendiculata]|uniref:30S ribosomal protein S20 n=1 Tax=Enterobacteriaceae endosymbiont of Macroplea appendiculata TaxID=2675790 RepID=UPI001449E5FF|nr:30S ribosomal protein S20 [Enterobacteriaceae endosymbiont of Macroplea appendiculata]QJC30688.1 30S ribosomal protein S20 [Enterobacteriaceae endosymbiont of Macroplea appendiculata]
MANIKSSKKRVLKSIQQKKNNTSYRTMIKTFIKKVKKTILDNNKTQSLIAFHKMQSIVDKQAHKGLIHKNKAARIKSRIYAKINNMI